MTSDLDARVWDPIRQFHVSENWLKENYIEALLDEPASYKLQRLGTMEERAEAVRRAGIARRLREDFWFYNDATLAEVHAEFERRANA